MWIWIKQLKVSFSVAYHFLKVTFQMMYASWRIAKLPQPCVTIFGGHLLKKDSFHVQQAHELARALVAQNISVLTGGGPGIMEAATCGAQHASDGIVRTMGVGVIGLRGEEGFNRCDRHVMLMDYFFARKHLLIAYSKAFVVFPGGYGTMDELSELLTLMQTSKVPLAPVFLIGKEYWRPYLEWVAHARKHGLLAQADEYLIVTTDSIEEVIQQLITLLAPYTDLHTDK